MEKETKAQRIIEYGNGSLYMSNWDAQADPEGSCIACRHCKKVWQIKYVWALRHIRKEHGVDWLTLTLIKTLQNNIELSQEAEEAHVDI